METDNRFFDCPVLNSPYKYPARHWELDESGQPTNRIVDSRREVSFVTPIPSPRQGRVEERTLSLDLAAERISTDSQEYNLTRTISAVREEVDRWRALPDPARWRVMPETSRLLQHWRHHKFNDIRPFFCQVEAVETVIWLTEVAPGYGKKGRWLLDHLESANQDANPGLDRLALKLATGAGKTTVMAMLIAWQTINAVRHPTSSRFTRGFLIVTPGITIKDRLRVLQPNDPDSYFRGRELVPGDMLGDIERARVVITNFHAFKLRETMDVSKGGRALLHGRGPESRFLETEGQMIQRVMPELMGMKKVVVLNDEAHHCYREKPSGGDEGNLVGDDKKEAEKNRETAKLWISGLEAVGRKLGLIRVVDLSATPFFLRGSGYAEGTLFPWTMSNFSLMDAIECGIVKLPRVPVSDNIPGDSMPKFRNLWEHIRKDMPKKGRGKSSSLDPLAIPVKLQTALEALYGHYDKTFTIWQNAGIEVPPCFIVICNNTSTSKLIYEYIAGFQRENADGSTRLENGRLPLFRNFDDNGDAIVPPPTLLIDSEQIESGEAIDKKFRTVASDEIERFRRELIERTGDRKHAENISDQDLLREAMNTVGKEGRLGRATRCVVSVSMLTEGWDANTVTHILGVRAFGTQLLCEQAVGRSLRRQSYTLNDEGLLPVEYADVLGIPFDFASKPGVGPPPPPPPPMAHVKAVIPDRDACEIRFPRVAGYRVELPEERLEAKFTDDSTLVLTPNLVGPSITRNEGIIGEGVDLNLVHTGELRTATLLFHLTKRLLEVKWRDPDDGPKLHLFGQLKRVARQWIDKHLVCKGNTYPAQIMYLELAEMACERITQGVVTHHAQERPIKAILDPYNPLGSTRDVDLRTSKKTFRTDARKCHINHAVLDSDWEAQFCRIAEAHPRVRAYVKNHGLGMEVPYRFGNEARKYIPDFILLVDDGRGEDDLLHLIVEIKGYRGEDAKDKKSTMDNYWVPGVNRLSSFGRWDFIELRDVYTFQPELDEVIATLVTVRAA